MFVFYFLITAQEETLFLQEAHTSKPHTIQNNQEFPCLYLGQ